MINMKRKLITIFVLLVVFGSAATAGIWYYATAEERLRAASVAMMPDFTFFREDGTAFTPGDISEDKNFILVFVSTGCPYCQREATAIHKNIDKFKDVPVYVVAAEPQENIRAFSKRTGLRDGKGVTLLRSDEKNFRNFNISAIPVILIYDKDQNLIERIEGYTEVDELLSHLPKV